MRQEFIADSKYNFTLAKIYNFAFTYLCDLLYLNINARSFME